jgi:hypothetical protein
VRKQADALRQRGQAIGVPAPAQPPGPAPKAVAPTLMPPVP